MATPKFSEIKEQTQCYLDTDDLMELRTTLIRAYQNKFISSPISRKEFPLNTRAGKQNLRDAAQVLLNDATITPTGLNATGWTKTLISTYLGKPDKLVTNPHYKSGPSMRLYYVSRVEAVACQAEVKAKLQKVLDARGNRQKGAAKAYETRTAKLREWVDNLEIVIPKIGIEQLLISSTNHYCGLHAGRSSWGHSDKTAGIMDSPDFLERITTNYLRHDCTDYESQLSQMAGKVGITELYPVLKERINNAISATYPRLYWQIIDFQAGYENILKERKQKKASEKLERKKLYLESLQTNPIETIQSRFKSRVKHLKEINTKKHTRIARQLYREIAKAVNISSLDFQLQEPEKDMKVTKQDIQTVLSEIETLNQPNVEVA